jgi:phage-related protein
LKSVIFFNQDVLKEIKSLPKEVRSLIGYALDLAAHGEKHENAKPMKGFPGVSVMEIVVDFNTNTYRTIYITEREDEIIVIDVFQKKSKSGIATPKEDIERIKKRYKALKGYKNESR